MGSNDDPQRTLRKTSTVTWNDTMFNAATAYVRKFLIIEVEVPGHCKDGHKIWAWNFGKCGFDTVAFVILSLNVIKLELDDFSVVFLTDKAEEAASGLWWKSPVAPLMMISSK